MTERSTDETLVTELRRVLQRLYDPGALARSPLVDLFGVDRRRNPTTALRRTLINAVGALKPAADVPLHSNAWRLYHVLLWRYVEQSKQNDVATNLAISPRQLRRLEWEAVRVLANYLSARYDLRHTSPGLDRGQPPRDDVSASPTTATPDREQELLWLSESFPSEIADTADLIAATLKTVEPLARASGTAISCRVDENLPAVTGQLAALRQALMSLLTAAIHASPGGKVKITVETDQHEIHILVRAANGRTGPSPGTEVTERIDMARQFVDLFGGTLTVSVQSTPAQPFSAELALPVAEQTPVLFIDDNADTLQLLRRYLSGTPYRFIGTSDPERVLPLAQEVRPQAIVLDIMLPGIDGWELLGRLREHPDIGGVPILVCTILPQDKLAMTLGAAGFLRKPVSREALLGALDRQMSRPGSRSDS